MRFHAAAPPGEWINDPNALFFKDGRYWLYAQHAYDRSDPKAIGWGAFESKDLATWRWTGRVIEPDRDGRSAYSGSIAATPNGHLVTALTRHDHVSGMQSQEWIGSTSDTFGPAGRDCRDPFILCAKPGKRAILIARPCNWHDWRTEPSSQLEIWREHGIGQWQCDGTIGPWSPPGVLWEVPQLLRIGDIDVLIVSTVDRRDDAVRSGVRYWFGAFSEQGFASATDWPAEGKLLDGGPDFYAAIANLEQGWPLPGRAIVGWASNWGYARTLSLPNGSGGGPITLLRSVSVSDCGTRLEQRPFPGHAALDRQVRELPCDGRLRLACQTGELVFLRTGNEVEITAMRDGLPRHREKLSAPVDERLTLSIFRDGPLIEIFVEPLGHAVTTLLPGLHDDMPLTLECAT